MVIMAVGWQVYHLTGQVLDLGLIGLSQFLPFLCLVLFSGHVADQFDRRVIIMLGHCAYMICTLLLLGFAWMNIRSTLPIFTVLGVLGITRAFQMPATQSFVPTIVPTATLRNALAINSFDRSGCSHRGSEHRRHRVCAGRAPFRPKQRRGGGLRRCSDIVAGGDHAGGLGS